MNNQRSCLECRSKLLGRADKRFCSQLCRTRYHNRNRDRNSRLVRRVNYILNRNRRILAEIRSLEVNRVPREELVDRGFDFSFHTHVLQVGEEEPHYFCYEYGWYQVDRELLCLVKGKEEVGEGTRQKTKDKRQK